MSEPTASRPDMPGYGLQPADSGDGLLPWSWATERLATSRNYWVSTTRPTGAPHAMAVWAVWIDGRLYFSTGEESRKARNLAADPRCVVTTEGAAEPVIIEGRALPVAGPAELAAFKTAYDAKYEVDIWTNGVFRVEPARVFSFIEAEEHFGSSATRWTFDASEA